MARKFNSPPKFYAPNLGHEDLRRDIVESFKKFSSLPPPPRPPQECCFVGGPWDDVTKFQLVPPGSTRIDVPTVSSDGVWTAHRYELSPLTGEWLWAG